MSCEKVFAVENHHLEHALIWFELIKLSIFSKRHGEGALATCLVKNGQRGCS